MNRLNRRTFTKMLATVPATGLMRGRDSEKFSPTWDSLKQHTVPEWFQDAKFGIFIHWGLYSVPAWAPPTGELGKIDWTKWFVENPYAEWYLNTLRIVDSPTYKHHVATYGKDFDYYRFTEQFNAETKEWDPASWASLFQNSGAKYVVLTTKHHDGFRLWPSGVTNPKAAGRDLSAKRDIAGDLTSAVRAAGLNMGLYYSGGLDWTFTSAPIKNREDLMARVPQSEEYARYADAHWRELIQRYQPAVLWNDISYPKVGQTAQIFAQYYDTVPGGIVNDRFSVPFSDFTTPEYANYEKITSKKWESCRGLGFSFGYNQLEGPEQVIAPDKLVALLVDIVSKNGNLLLNIGPKPDGTISDIQLDRLHKLGDWMKVNGEAIHGTRPWVKPSAKGEDGSDVRFTRKGDSLYAIFLNRPDAKALVIPGVRGTKVTTAEILGMPAQISTGVAPGGLSVQVMGDLPKTLALAVKITPAPEPA